MDERTASDMRIQPVRLPPRVSAADARSRAEAAEDRWRSNPETAPDYWHTLQEIEEHFDRLRQAKDLVGELNATCTRIDEIIEEELREGSLPSLGDLSPVVVGIHRIWNGALRELAKQLEYDMTKEDFYFGAIVLHTLTDLCKIHASTQLNRDFIKGLRDWAHNRGTMDELEEGAAVGDAIRDEIRKAYAAAKDSIDHIELIRLRRLSDTNIDALNRWHEKIDTRFPFARNRYDHGPPGASVPWFGLAADHYRSIVSFNLEAAERLVEVAGKAKLVLLGYVSSFNDFMAGLKSLEIQVVATLGWILVQMVKVLRWLYRLRWVNNALRTLQIFSTASPPLRAQAEIVSRLVKAYGTLTVGQILYAIFDRGASIMAAVTAHRKNELTLDEHTPRYLSELRLALGGGTELPRGDWPDWASEKDSPRMVHISPGRWRLQLGDGHRLNPGRGQYVDDEVYGRMTESQIDVGEPSAYPRKAVTVDFEYIRTHAFVWTLLGYGFHDIARYANKTPFLNCNPASFRFTSPHVKEIVKVADWLKRIGLSAGSSSFDLSQRLTEIVAGFEANEEVAAKLVRGGSGPTPGGPWLPGGTSLPAQPLPSPADPRAKPPSPQ